MMDVGERSESDAKFLMVDFCLWCNLDAKLQAMEGSVWVAYDANIHMVSVCVQFKIAKSCRRGW